MSKKRLLGILLYNAIFAPLELDRKLLLSAKSFVFGKKLSAADYAQLTC